MKWRRRQALFANNFEKKKHSVRLLTSPYITHPQNMRCDLCCIPQQTNVRTEGSTEWLLVIVKHYLCNLCCIVVCSRIFTKLFMSTYAMRGLTLHMPVLLYVPNFSLMYTHKWHKNYA